MLNKMNLKMAFRFIFLISICSIISNCNGKFEVGYDQNKVLSSPSITSPSIDTNIDSNLSKKNKVGLSQTNLEFTEGSIALISIDIEEKNLSPVKLKILGLTESGEVLDVLVDFGRHFFIGLV